VRIVSLTLPKNEKNFFPKVDGCNNLKKTNKGISSYKLSASQDPKLHAESHSHFGRKDVMLQ